MKKGFTLVELAIVMIIIGLLIGGILKGTEMIENAKVSSTLAQVKAYTAAVYTFQDTYSAMPGDMRNALDRVPGCTGSTNCLNGGGNSLVDEGAGGQNIGWSTKLSTNPAWYETIQFWKHLVLADLITGVTTDAATGAADLAWGESHPSAKIGGGFEFFHDAAMNTGAGGNNNSSAHIFRLSNSGISTGGSAAGAEGARPVSPLRGYQMDRKVDDGNPNSGSVLANYGQQDEDGCKTADDNYKSQERRKNCLMFFVF